MALSQNTAPTVMSDEDLYQQTGSWDAAAALRDQQNNALNQYNWSQPATTSGLDTLSTNTTIPNAYTKQYAGKDYTLDPTAVTGLYNQIVGQGTMGKWTGEGFGSAEANAKAIAENLAASGITDLSQIAQKEITTPASSYETEQGTVEVPASSQTVLVNSVTGQPLVNDYAERATGNAFSGTYTGEGNTAYRVGFDAQGKPIVYTTGASSSDTGDLQMLLAAASFIPGVAPFAQAANAAISAGQGNWTGAALGALGAGQAAGFTDFAGIPIKDARNIVGGLNAIDKGNVAGIVNSGMNLAGVNLPSEVRTGVTIANAVNAAKNNDIAGLVDAAGTLTGSKDIKLASSALKLTNAVNAFDRTGDPTTLINAAQGFSKSLGGSDLVKILAEEPDNQGSGMWDSTVPSWVSTAQGEQVTGSRVDSQGQTRYEITRANPNDEDKPVVYEAVLDPETGKVSYEWGGVSVDEEGNVIGGGSTVSSGSKPSWTWETETGASSDVKDISENAVDISTDGASDNTKSVLDSATTAGIGSGSKGTEAGTDGTSVNAGSGTKTNGGVGAGGDGEKGTGAGTGDGTGGDGTGGDGTGGNGTGGDGTGGDGTGGDGDVTKKIDDTVTKKVEDTVVTQPLVVNPPVVTSTRRSTAAAPSTSSPLQQPKLSYKKVYEETPLLNPVLFSLAGVPMPVQENKENILSSDIEEEKEKQEEEAKQEEAPALDLINFFSFAEGGLVPQHPMGEPEFYSEGGAGTTYIEGRGDGTSDQIPAMVANNEYVLPADVVSALGNGSSESGASVLDQFIETIRSHKHSNPPSELPPESKGPLEYLSNVLTKGKR